MEAEREEETKPVSEEARTEPGEEIPQIELRDLQAERDPMGAGSPKSDTPSS